VKESVTYIAVKPGPSGRGYKATICGLVFSALPNVIVFAFCSLVAIIKHEWLRQSHVARAYKFTREPAELEPLELERAASVLSVDQAVFRARFVLRPGVDLSRVSKAPPQGLERCQERKSPRSHSRRRGTPGDVDCEAVWRKPALQVEAGIENPRPLGRGVCQTRR